MGNLCQESLRGILVGKLSGEAFLGSFCGESSWKNLCGESLLKISGTLETLAAKCMNKKQR